jgi:hypothetical protein
VTADEQLYYVIERAHGKLRFRVTDNLWTRTSEIAALTGRRAAELTADRLNTKYRDERHWCTYDILREIS